jgi:hypothetical protein
MTSPQIRRQAYRSMRRHPSETTLLRRDGRYVNRKLMQAAPADTSPSLFGLMVAIAFLAAPLLAVLGTMAALVALFFWMGPVLP